MNAAKFIRLFNLNQSQNIYQTFKLGKDKLSLDICCDVIILVNWIHAIETPVLKKMLDDLTTKHLKIGGTLILDILSDESLNLMKSEVNLHKIEDIIDREKFEIKKKSGYKMGRKIVVAVKR